MKIEKIIQVSPQVIKNNSDKFELEDLQDLEQVLAALDTKTEAELEQLLTDWFKTHKQVRDTIRKFTKNRELNGSPELPPNSEAGILQNLFELRQTNQEVIKAKTNQQHQDQSQK